MRSFQLPDLGARPISVEEAQQRVLAGIEAGPVETVSLAEAHGRVLGADVVAAEDVPLFDNSAMDGYALRSADTPGALRVIGDVAAGSHTRLRIEPGTAARIMTGALIPEGADAVAQVEITDGGLEVVNVSKEVRAGANVRERGGDMRAGSIVLRSGTPIGPAEIAALATAGASSVVVGKKPVVAIMATGDELVEPGERGGVVNSNSHALAALVREAGGIPRMLGIVRDQRETTIRAIESALDCDFIVSSGGVSVGAYDFVKEALEVLGAETKFWRVSMKPGKPVLFAKVRGRAFFGLPGNPASSMTSFLLFVGPAIRKAGGQTRDLFAPAVRMTTSGPLKGTPDRRTYVRVSVAVRDGRLVAEPIRAQGSHQVTSMIRANGFAVVEAGTGGLEAGSEVTVLLTGSITSSGG